MQVPLQFVSPPWHVVAHAPFEHTDPAGQTCPQEPQFAGSTRVAVQVLPQSA
jgi:hypothetical protein